MEEYEFTAEVQQIDGGKCRLVIPLHVSKSFGNDIWFIESLKVDGKVLKNKSISKNMRKYYYILVDRTDVKGDRYADVTLKV